MCGKQITVIVQMKSGLLKNSDLEQYPGLGLGKLMFKTFSVCSFVCLSFGGFCNFALFSVNKGKP